MNRFAIFAAGTALMSVAAIAEPVVVVIADEAPAPIERVSFDDLDLGSAAGQQRLVKRIKGAAERVCDDIGHTGLDALQYRHCFNVALGGGRRQMEQLLAARENGAMIATASLSIRRQ